MINYTYVNWYIPKPLYDALVTLQEGLRGPDTKPKWETVEALAVHFLSIAVLEAHKELEQKARQTRLVQPATVMPRIIEERRL